MISEHASPLAALGGADAGGQNVHVAALATGLARRGHEVTVFTRRDAAGLPDTVPLAPGVTVEHVLAGPARYVPKDDLPACMPRFADWLGARWTAAPPEVAHAHFWMSGLAAVRAAGGRCAGGADLPRARPGQAPLSGPGGHQPARARRGGGRGRAAGPARSSPPAPTRCASWPVTASRRSGPTWCPAAWTAPISGRRPRRGALAERRAGHPAARAARAASPLRADDRTPGAAQGHRHRHRGAGQGAGRGTGRWPAARPRTG